MHDTLGLYLSIPFCKAKCSFCNFASDVFAPARLDGYVDRLCEELHAAPTLTHRLGANLPHRIDTVYFGGGTPSLLQPHHLQRLFASIHAVFDLAPTAEITLEAAPGQLSQATLAEAIQHGINRVSFGVQSFIDVESAAVGRQHTGAQCLAEIARMHAAGIERVSLDLIAGLPHQTAASWEYSLDQAVHSEAGHVSIYLLEVDEDSRLGREALAGGNRYHAGALPSDDETAEWYLSACERLKAAGLHQYEISNFARPGFASRHNLKYWQRAPYLGVGLDAHSMLPTTAGEAIRWANPDDLDRYVSGTSATGIFPMLPGPNQPDRIGLNEALEEELFLGLRLNAGVDLERLRDRFGATRVEMATTTLTDIQSAGLIEGSHANIRLTPRGRLASNEVFSRLLVA